MRGLAFLWRIRLLDMLQSRIYRWVIIFSVESKINYLAPAKGETLCAVGRVIRPGRRLSVVVADLFAITEKTQQKIAILQTTMMPVAPEEAQGARSF